MAEFLLPLLGYDLPTGTLVCSKDIPSNAASCKEEAPMVCQFAQVSTTHVYRTRLWRASLITCFFVSLFILFCSSSIRLEVIAAEKPQKKTSLSSRESRQSPRGAHCGTHPLLFLVGCSLRKCNSCSQRSTLAPPARIQTPSANAAGGRWLVACLRLLLRSNAAFCSGFVTHRCTLG